jgi:ATP-dependent helicase HepA
VPPVLQFHIGQCWMSEAEPELGIGFVRSFDSFGVEVEYPASSSTRRYNKRTAPLRRLEFRIGDMVRPAVGEPFEVNRIEVVKGLNWYFGRGAKRLCELDLSPEHKLQRPLERFLAGHVDPLRAFQLRRQTLEYRDQMLRSQARGLIGPRVMLLPHQAYVVSQVAQRGLPRALLADEVGLGKTIEAGWILHQLVVTERVRRVLLIVPQALVNQWFVEMLRRFNLSFWVPESQTDEPLVGADLVDHERVILALESLDNREILESLLEIEWDMIVVDEAHRIEWTDEAPSLEYAILEDLTLRAPGLLLLTATPEQLGLEGHFGRLRLVDPQRFKSWKAYQKEHDKYLQVVELAEALHSGKKLPEKSVTKLKSLLKDKVDPKLLSDLDDARKRRSVMLALVDHYGTGRIYFRNARRVVQLEDFSFPKRILKEHAMELPKSEKERKDSEKREDALVPWLAGFLKDHPDDKVLLICSTARLVTRLKERLLNEYAIRAVDFHEEQPLLARDRNAAYFEDPAGARVLLSSEIGGEGRNFQHAKHLVLADLPVEPDVLEQRIGRLDRIGQQNDIELHVPYIEGSREQVLLRWYRDVFQVFAVPASGAAQVHDDHFDELEKFLVTPKLAFDKDAKEFEALVKKARKKYEETLEVIEQGRDRLIEINSFDPVDGTAITQAIEKSEKSAELRAYLEAIFDGMGIHAEPVDKDVLFVEPGDSMFTTYFPALPPEGMRMAFSRTKALARDDLTMMSWDHPMVTGTLDAILSQEFGNISAAGWTAAPKTGAPPLLVEAYFFLECVADSKWNPDQFFPTEPIRILLNGRNGEVVNDTWPVEKLHPNLVQLTHEQAGILQKIPGAVLRGLLERATADAEKGMKEKVAKSTSRMDESVRSEILRLKALQGKNRLVSDREILWWEERQRNLSAAFKAARLRLDSFLLVIPVSNIPAPKGV